jgi:hypothetical protein
MKIRNFYATGYFYRGETMYVSIVADRDWAKMITQDVLVFLNVSFIASDGGRIDLVVCYNAWTTDISGSTRAEPALDLINVSMIGSSGDVPVSEASARALAKAECLGGTVQRDCNLTVALDSRSVFNNFYSDVSPLIVLRASKTVFLYSYLLPFGLVLAVLAVPLLVFGWRKRKRRSSK